MGFGFGDVLKGVASTIPGVGQFLGAKEQADTSYASARDQMSFQERMSNSSHQREVNDLRLAGLNPVLSVNSGASTPVGSTYSESSNPYSGISDSLNTAMQYMTFAKNLRLTDSTIRRNNIESDIKEPAAGFSRMLTEGFNSAVGGIKDWWKKGPAQWQSSSPPDTAKRQPDVWHFDQSKTHSERR